MTPKENYLMAFHDNGKFIMGFNYDGTVEINPELTVDEASELAAKIFARCLVKYATEYQPKPDNSKKATNEL